MIFFKCRLFGWLIWNESIDCYIYVYKLYLIKFLYFLKLYYIYIFYVDLNKKVLLFK